MTERALEQQQMEAAARGVAAKLQAFHAGLTPDEQQVLSLALRYSGADADEAAGDTSGHMVMAGPLGPLVVVTVPAAVVLQQIRSMLGLQ
jgi:hypothetical protein